MRSMSHLVVSAAFLMVLSACAPGDLAGLIEPADIFDLSESDDPAVQAAGEAWRATVATQDAEDALAKGIAESDLEAVQEAAALRPEDPRYPIYEQILTTQQTLDDTCTRTVDGCAAVPSARDHRIDLAEKGLELLSAQHPDWSDGQKRRTFTEMQLDATRAVLESRPDLPERDRILEVYCSGVTGGYQVLYGTEFPQETSTYLLLQVGEPGLALCN